MRQVAPIRNGFGLCGNGSRLSQMTGSRSWVQRRDETGRPSLREGLYTRVRRCGRSRKWGTAAQFAGRNHTRRCIDGALNGLCKATKALKAAKLASGGILVLVCSDVNGAVQKLCAPVVCAIASEGTSGLRRKVE